MDRPTGFCRRRNIGERYSHRKTRSHQPLDRIARGYASNAGLARYGRGRRRNVFLGHFANNDQERETGLLSGEAGIDAFLDTEILKYAFGRDRPFTGDGRGLFFQGGDSFPSQHAAISWAIASVIAMNTPARLPRCSPTARREESPRRALWDSSTSPRTCWLAARSAGIWAGKFFAPLALQRCGNRKMGHF